MLKQSIKLHDKFGTVRKLAKSIRGIISIIAKINGWYGPLFKDLQRLYLSLTISPEEAVYCSEFNSDNYDQDMPPKIREALQHREQKIKDERSKFSYIKNKPKQKLGKRSRSRNR